ncbi:MAG: hypothetical protein R3C19_15210 [Planctomycetaceae bacterium]
MTTISGQAHRIAIVLAALLMAVVAQPESLNAGQLMAGAARVDITSPTAGPAHGRLHARALVLQDGDTTAVVVTLDVVAIGEIGHIGNDFLPAVRARVSDELGILPRNILVNASHCHGIPCDDVADKTVQAIVEAAGRLVPVRAGVGRGHEDRIMENRRLKLNDGREIDVRHAYSMPPDEDVAEVGPIDPEIGVLRLDREDGSVLAVVYNFACHPIQGVPGGLNTSDITGFASQVIEDNLDKDAVALFVQGCGGDINPAFYKDVSLPRNAEPLGQTLGLSTLKAVRRVVCESDGPLRVLNESIELPRADLSERITAMEAEKERLLRSLGGTTLNLKTFLPLVVRYRLDDNFPSYYSHSYLNERQLGRNHLERLDDENRRAIDQYIRNIHTMEQLTRLQTNQRLLEKHQAHYVAAGRRTVDAEVAGLRVGTFRLVTFPGELTVQIGLNLKSRSPFENTFVAGYTNGYLYYSPTAEQLRNVGNAQEDSDCLLAPEWQAIFEQKALDVLAKLGD